MTEAAMRSSPAVYFDGVTSAAARGDGRLHSRRRGHPQCRRQRDCGVALCAAEASQRTRPPSSASDCARASGWSGSKSRTRTSRTRSISPAPISTAPAPAPAPNSAGPSAASFAAAVSLLLVAFYGIPQIADQLAPVMPQAIEQRLGNAADTQVRAMFDKGPKDRPFECGSAPVEAEGKKAFDKLMARLEKGGGVRHSDPRGRGAARGGQCRHPARRPRLRVRGADRQGRGCRRGGGRDRPRTRPCRQSGRSTHPAPGGRAVAGFRQPSRRFRRRRRRGICRRNRC